MTLVSSRSLPYSRQSSHRGFSIVEVIITMAIVTILTALVMVRYGSFNSAVLLKNQAYEIALTIREAQISAISVRGEDGVADGFREAFGFYADANNAEGEFRMWRDGDGDAAYDAGEETVTVQLDSRFYISRICSDEADPCTDVGAVSIGFQRPNFDAIICQSGTCTGAVTVIELTTYREPFFTRRVVVRQAGQISVE